MRRSLWRICILAWLGLQLTSCSRLFDTRIADLLKNPRAFEGKVVTVSGKVVDRGSIILVKYFTLKDTTGQINVITKHILPEVGSKIRVKGRLKEAFSFGDTRMLVLIEEEASSD
jgi:hypothetical protein